jgi:hypothetical protein
MPATCFVPHCDSNYPSAKKKFEKLVLLLAESNSEESVNGQRNSSFKIDYYISMHKAPKVSKFNPLNFTIFA